MRTCYVTEFKNLIGYKDGLELQNRAFKFVVQNNMDGILLLLQHKPVITIGKSGGIDNLLVSRKALNRFGIELYKSSRGGNITYHGPGQLVAYPILNLGKFQKDAHWYLRQLETVVMNTVRYYGVKAGIKPKLYWSMGRESKTCSNRCRNKKVDNKARLCPQYMCK